MNNDNEITNLDELIIKITSEDFDKFNTTCFSSRIPKKCLEGNCILGVDEAGRGPVLGPMVYAVCYCSASETEILKTIGCTDSKALTERKREEIFGLINENKDTIGWAAEVISPNFISNQMLKRVKYSLNEIAQNSTVNLIKSILEKNIKISEIYVDTIGPPDKYQKASEIKNVIKLSTGCHKLDEHLSGGLSVEGITEFCGESGSGKSQLCMQLALTAQYPESFGGLNGNVIYICTEEHFQSKRLYQLIDKFPSRFHGEKNFNIEFSNNIFILHVSELEDLENSFDKISLLVKAKNIKLIVLDSITALFRGSSTDSSGRQKARGLRFLAKNFYKLIGEFGVMIICVNQVSEEPSTGKGPIPALGLVWANLVTTRIHFKKCGSQRSFVVVFSPEIRAQQVMYKITESGVVGT